MAQHRRGAQDGGERRAQFVRNRADQRLAQQLGLGAHLGLVERVRDVEPLERGGGIRQHVVDALAHLRDGTSGHVAEIDGDHAEIGRPLRNTADEPDIAGGVGSSGGERRAASNVRDGGTHRFGHRGVIRLGVAAVAFGSEQHHLALHETGEMLLDPAVDVCRGRRCRQPAREGVKIAHLVLVLAGELGLPLHRIGEMAGDQRNDHEQNEIDDLARSREVVAVERRIEKIAGPQHAGHRRHQRRHQPEMPAGQHDRQVDDRSAPKVEIADQRPGNDRRRGDHQQGQRNAAQLAPKCINSQCRSPPQRQGRRKKKYPVNKIYGGPGAVTPAPDECGRFRAG